MVLNIWGTAGEVPVTINSMSSTEINSSFCSETLLLLVVCDTFNDTLIILLQEVN